MLTSFHRLGSNGGVPRVWLESARLNRLGFRPGAGFTIDHGSRRLTLNLTDGVAGHHVSSKRIRCTQRPIIDICSSVILRGLSGFDEIRVQARSGRIEITPSARGFQIQKSRQAGPPFRVMELFAGGGTLSAACAQSPLFRILAGVEIEPGYADIWEAAHPEAELINSDLRLIHPSEVQPFDILVAGIPCTDHSIMGRAKKSLKGRPEMGEGGDLFLSVAHLVAHHLPLACVFENVPNFSTSMAGASLKLHLARLGYSVFEAILEPHAQWGEPSDRRRWLMIATLKPVAFQLEVPGTPFTGTVRDYLDAPDAVQDQADAERIAVSITGRLAHNARHRAKGNFFATTIIDGSETKLPTIPKSYHKINVGPFVSTPYGARLLRQSEIERIMGSRVATEHYATAVQVLCQGVQSRIFRQVFDQLGAHLCGK
jgi:DNA (cytosine-5)-methyltransferase 1